MKLTFLILLITVKSVSQAQTGYTVNDMTVDFQVSKIINSSASSSSFQNLNDRLLVVDFFGTWCAPCVRALPKLSALQKKYKDQVRILLVSDESIEKLTSFISKQNDFIFPVVVDEAKIFTKYFQPPSYPYSFIVDKNGRVIAIPTQEDMTEKNIDKWLIMQNETFDSVEVQTIENTGKPITFGYEAIKTKVEPSQNKLVQLSQDFMYAAKTGEETSGFIVQLKNISIGDLTATVKTDKDKKAFWINLYNAYTQVALKNDPGQYNKRGQFFGNRSIEIAGTRFSLDDMEHGILRRSKIKWSLGYFNKLFPKRIEKQLRVDKLDYRLHFALNCGAKSCPPIAFYKSETINQQLVLATKAYLTSESTYDETTNTVKLPILMSWFRRDFGGKRKILELLKQLLIVPVDKKPTIKFKSYDWTIYLNNYK
jgi:thiol-disulfide isomerase/thioredoxin